MLLDTPARWARILSVGAVLGIALLGAVPGHAYGLDEVDLELGGAGSTAWSIGNVKPGDSGTETVELRNTGSQAGEVTIWIDEVVGSDYGGDGAALADYLFFNISSTRVTANVSMPARITEFPRSATDARYIKIDSLNSGETVTLTWEWQFRETGQPQDDAQGDSLSFSINYLLEGEGVPPPPPGGSDPGKTEFRWLQIDVMGQTMTVAVTSLGVILDPCTAADLTGETSLQFEAGTRVTSVGGEVPVLVELTAGDLSPTAPEGFELIGPGYELTGYTYSPYPGPVDFSRPVRLTIAYDPGSLSADNATINIGRYDTSTGWTLLEAPPGEEAIPGRVSTLIRHSMKVGILAAAIPLPELSTPAPSPSTTPPPSSERLAPLPSEPGDIPPPRISTAPHSPVATQPVPAQFELSGLEIDPVRVEPGEPVTVSIGVRNTGEQEGEYTLDLVLNGDIEQSHSVMLAGGKYTRMVFTLVRQDPGDHTVMIGGLSTKFTIVAPVVPASGSATLIWAAALSAPMAGLLVYLYAIKFKIFV